MKKILLTILLLSVPVFAQADWFSSPANVDNTTIEKSASKLRVKDGGISAAKIASDAVTTVKILDSNVTTNKIANQAVTSTKATALLGAVVSKSDNTVYQAATDGQFCGTVTCGTSSFNVGKIEVYTDSSNPPTTLMTGANCQVHQDTVSQTTTSNIGGFCIYVRKNDYYKGVLTSVNSGGGSTGASATYTFQPIGS